MNVKLFFYHYCPTFRIEKKKCKSKHGKTGKQITHHVPLQLQYDPKIVDSVKST